MPPAGARILNQAEADYATQGFNQHIPSNPVRLFVSHIEALSLTQPNQRNAAPGSPVAMPHRLVNPGNVAATYTLQLSAQSGDFNLDGLHLVRDLNSNGLADAGEPSVSSTDSIALQPGESADFVVMGTVPSAMNAQSVANAQIVAVSTGQNASAANVDKVVVSAGAAVSVRKSATPSNAARGQLVTWNLTANSTGASSPNPIAVSVDGTPARRARSTTRRCSIRAAPTPRATPRPICPRSPTRFKSACRSRRQRFRFTPTGHFRASLPSRA